jgi:hypothetical protein
VTGKSGAPSARYRRAGPVLTADAGDRSSCWRLPQLRRPVAVTLAREIAPAHFYSGGKFIGDLPLEWLVGPACVVDLERMGLGDYDLYGPEHFERWERDTGTTIEPDDILIIHTGYHKHYPEDWASRDEVDETKYFIRHPRDQPPLTAGIAQRAEHRAPSHEGFPLDRALGLSDVGHRRNLDDRHVVSVTGARSSAPQACCARRRSARRRWLASPHRSPRRGSRRSGASARRR